MQFLPFFIIFTLMVVQLSVRFIIAQETPSEFIIAMRNYGTLSAETEKVKAQILQRFGASVKKDMAIGEMRFLVTTTSAANALKISEEITEVLYVAPNSVVKAYVPSTEKHSPTMEEETTKSSSNRDGNDGRTTAQTTATRTKGKASRPNAAGDFCYEQQSGDELWGLTRIVRREAWNPGDNNTPEDEVYTYSSVDDGNGVDIFIVDTGIMTRHNDFNGRAVEEYTVPAILAIEGSDDVVGHGTHVAGIAGATTYGVAKNVTLRSVKVLTRDGGSSAWVVEGLTHIYESYISEHTSTGKRPSWVINMSLGSSIVDPVLNDAVQGMVQAGIIVVVAAGNAEVDACTGSPASVTEAIVVGATDDQDRLASFSNYGPCVDVLAPGVRIRSTFIPLRTSVLELQGTSMSSPFVAGVIARYIQGMDEPPLPAQVEAWLTNSTTEGVIDVEIGSSFSNITTDKLLYKACTPGPEYEVDDDEDGEHSGTTFGHRSPMGVTVFLMVMIMMKLL